MERTLKVSNVAPVISGKGPPGLCFRRPVAILLEECEAWKKGCDDIMSWWIFQQRASLSGLCLEQMSNGWPFSLMTSKWAKWGLIIKLGNLLRFLKTIQKIVQSDMAMLDGSIQLTSWGLWLISSQQEWNAITLISSDGWLAKNEKDEINRCGWMNISNAWKPRNKAMPS